jgi:hypothetical protein
MTSHDRVLALQGSQPQVLPLCLVALDAMVDGEDRGLGRSMGVRMSDQSRRSARSFVSRSIHALDRASAAEGASSAKEPCIGCGEETAVGSVFFSDRYAVEHSDGTRTYLCTLCYARIRALRKACV